VRPSLTVSAAVIGLLLPLLVASAQGAAQTPSEQEDLELARELEEDGDLDRAREKYDDALRSMRERSAPQASRAAIHEEYAEVLAEWSESEDALEHFRQTIELLRSADVDFERIVAVRLAAADAQVQVDEDAAEESYRAALSEIEERLGEAHPLRAQARLSLGALFARQSWMEGAAEQIDIALTPLRIAQPDSEELADLLVDAADRWFWVDENDRAINLRNQALSMRRRLFGEGSEGYLQALKEEADWRSEWDYDSDAASFYRVLTDRYESEEEPDAETLSAVYSGLGAANWEQAAESAGALRAAISIRRQAGLETLEQARDLSDLASKLRYGSDYYQTEELSEEALGNLDEIARLYSEALRISRAVGEKGLWSSHSAALSLAGVFKLMDRRDEAATVLREQIAAEEASDDDWVSSRSWLWEQLGDLYLEDEDPGAVEAYARMLALREEEHADDETALQESLEQLRAACETLGLEERAEALSPRLRRIAWKNLASEYEWIEPLASREGLNGAVSPFAFFGFLFLSVGLVVAGAGGTVSLRLSRASDERARGAELAAPSQTDALTSSPEPPKTHRARFHGDGRELFGIFVVNSLWSILTLSLYYFWGKVRVRRYVWSHGEFAGDRFAFHGTPLELFMGWLKGSPVLAAVIWGPTIVLMYSQSSEAENWATVGVIALVALLWPIAEIGAHRYRLSRTSWRAIRFSFHGKTWRYALIYLLNWPIWLFTLGLWTPFFNAIKRRYLMNHMRFGDSRFECSARGGELFKAYLVNWLLFIPTLGLYSFWYLAFRERYYWSKTTYRGAQFRSTITGSQLFELTMVAGLLMVITLGLAWPWVRTWRMKVWLESIELDGALDLHAIRQDRQATDATGEGFADFLGVDFGFFE